FSAIILCRSRCSAGYRPCAPPSFLALDLGALLERLRLGNGVHPLPELFLVVQQLRDARLGVLVFGAPEQRIEGTHLDADAAVHAERVVDVETVEHAHVARLAAFAPRGSLLLVPLDVYAPVGTL